ncbi:MAG: flagellar basal body P-ring protein FlgI [Stenotrophomonas sp.]
MTDVRLTLRNPDFTTAQRVAAVINAAYPAVGPGRERHGRRPCARPAELGMAGFISRVENLAGPASIRPAKVIIDEVNGVIVMGDAVRISTVAIAQGNLTISVRRTAAGQPARRPSAAAARPSSCPQTQTSTSTKRSGHARCGMVGGGDLPVHPGQRPERPGRQPARHDQHPAGHQGRRRPAGRHRGDVSMTDPTVSADLLRPHRGRAHGRAIARRCAETAKAFEATFMSQMLKPMFEGLSTDGLLRRRRRARRHGAASCSTPWPSPTVKAGGVGLSQHRPGRNAEDAGGPAMTADAELPPRRAFVS